MAVRLALGSIFIYASWYKIIEPQDFAKSTWYYHMVPGSLINLMAIFLPWLELVCGVAMILRTGYRGALALQTAMTLVFVYALGSAISRNLNIDCGCFKAAASATHSAWLSLWFDLGMLILLAQLWLSRSKRWMLCRD